MALLIHRRFPPAWPSDRVYSVEYLVRLMFVMIFILLLIRDQKSKSRQNLGKFDV